MPTVGLANDIEVKFQSAVELVRSLPQKGSFQPSYSDASKVYGYYKQANCGPCSGARPAFWDVVRRAKWDAWNVLGDMPKYEAMENYVNEIKKLFVRLINMDEFQEAQANFSHVIVPFCESNGLEVPATLAECRKIEKKKKEKKKMEDALKRPNGIANGHANQLEKRSIAELEGDNSQFISMSSEEASINESTFDANGTMDHTADTTTGDVSANSEDVMPVQAVNGDRTNIPPEAVFAEISSYIDAESSDDDDLYCDSINPDEISSPSQTKMATLDESQLLHNARDTNAMEEETGLVLKNSTPIVKIKSNLRDDLHSNTDANSDLSALSSVSGEVNGRQNVASTRNEVESNVAGLELELKYEFESKASFKHGSRSRNKNHGRDRRERQQDDVIGRRGLVIGARGNSQTDLAGSGGASREREESASVEQHRAGSSRPATGQSSTRLRRTKADSSSDSNHSTGSSAVSGETIGEQIVRALGRLEHDMRLVLQRLDSIENRITDVNRAVNRRPWWTAYLPSRRYLFLLFWPILIHYLFAFWRRKRKK